MTTTVTNTNWVNGRDAAFADDIGSGFQGVVQGYFGGPNAYHVWSRSEWAMFGSNRKMPTWVCGYNGADEASAALAALGKLGVPHGCPIVADMENRVDITYLLHFGEVMQKGGFLVIVYGSASTVLGNPKLNGYQVADWTGHKHMYAGPDGRTVGIRGTQWTDDVPPGFDKTVWKAWDVRNFWV